MDTSTAATESQSQSPMSSPSNSSPSSFIHFPLLPYELRDQIWNDALPEIPNSNNNLSLYFYRETGLWQPFDLPEDDPGYLPGTNDNLGIKFRTDLIDSLDYQFHPLELSLVFVNREARRVALKWLDKNGIQILQMPSSNTPQASERIAPKNMNIKFTLPFNTNPQSSTLYIPRSKWTKFCTEPQERMFEPDLQDKSVDIHCRNLSSIAIPESILRDDYRISYLPETVQMWFFSVRTVYVILEDDTSLTSILPGEEGWESQLQAGFIDWSGEEEVQVNHLRLWPQIRPEDKIQPVGQVEKLLTNFNPTDSITTLSECQPQIQRWNLTQETEMRYFLKWDSKTQEFIILRRKANQGGDESDFEKEEDNEDNGSQLRLVMEIMSDESKKLEFQEFRNRIIRPATAGLKDEMIRCEISELEIRPVRARAVCFGGPQC